MPANRPQPNHGYELNPGGHIGSRQEWGCLAGGSQARGLCTAVGRRATVRAIRANSSARRPVDASEIAYWPSRERRLRSDGQGG